LHVNSLKRTHLWIIWRNWAQIRSNEVWRNLEECFRCLCIWKMEKWWFWSCLFA